VTLRVSNLERIADGRFDVLVVGAGINGAVTAAALGSRGARVALVDRGDFAGFTSEQSSNLVWGGFKYLEHYEFRLVRNLCRSRNRLIRAYPANVQEIRFLAALDRNAPYRPWFATAGALTYWLIGNGFLRAPRHVRRRRLAQVEPVIDTKTVRGGIGYSDAYLIDDDSRFVFGFVIGTTDERVTDPETHVEADDRDFLLGQINARLDLPVPITPDDVISAGSGVRPLVVERSRGAPHDADWTSLSRCSRRSAANPASGRRSSRPPSTSAVSSTRRPGARW
jgi:glycerol-3-phosphate dehydrogenase